ncbi:hypothetical protein JKP88DRAFT_353736 [Tribonema minus]|uniref:Uncharacterized protein n=1 Tax=Tribonema minus TaxID=303371 RepID=A0A835Z4R8_9STRA|nr:hypothetical protein JKP88DRAFT_353736 [Tribonema minus]
MGDSEDMAERGSPLRARNSGKAQGFWSRKLLKRRRSAEVRSVLKEGTEQGAYTTRARLALGAAASLWCLAFVTRSWWPLRVALVALLLEPLLIASALLWWTGQPARSLASDGMAAACSFAAGFWWAAPAAAVASGAMQILLLPALAGVIAVWPLSMPAFDCATAQGCLVPLEGSLMGCLVPLEGSLMDTAAANPAVSGLALAAIAFLGVAAAEQWALSRCCAAGARRDGAQPAAPLRHAVAAAAGMATAKGLVRVMALHPLLLLDGAQDRMSPPFVPTLAPLLVTCAVLQLVDSAAAAAAAPQQQRSNSDSSCGGGGAWRALRWPVALHGAYALLGTVGATCAWPVAATAIARAALVGGAAAAAWRRLLSSPLYDALLDGGGGGSGGGSGSGSASGDGCEAGAWVELAEMGGDL